jgi:hypothetical protein
LLLLFHFSTLFFPRFTAKSEKREVTLAVEVSARPIDRDTPLIPPKETEYKIDQKRPIYLFFSVEDTGPFVPILCYFSMLCADNDLNE